MHMRTQPWIGKPIVDLIFILLPSFLALALVGLIPAQLRNEAAVTDISWLVLVVLIDVSHVYTTLYRTYFDPLQFRQNKYLLTTVPLFGLVITVLLYSVNAMLFWRVLAYTAVFHFIRQQYGFMRIYSRKETVPSVCKRIDTWAIYTATIYPIVYWHLSGPRNFNWFLKGDFFYLTATPTIIFVLKVCYIGVVMLYVCKEIWMLLKGYAFNIPRNMIMLGTLLSWYLGIVYFNGDLIFTLLNVIGHGIPYMALVWIYGQKEQRIQKGLQKGLIRKLYGHYGVILFVLIVVLFAFLEESLWDILVWKENEAVLLSGIFPSIQLPAELLSFVVPILALPQLTHYILDAFIWKVKGNAVWSDAFRLSE